MIRSTIVIGYLLAIVTTFVNADELHSQFPTPVTPASKKLEGGSIQGEALLRVNPETVRRGESVRVECELRCTSGASDVWNGFLSEDAILPAQIVITSTDGKVRHELLVRQEEVKADRQPTRWILLRSTDSIGRELHVKVGSRPQTAPDQSSRERIVDLPPGEYRVQAIYNHWLIAPRSRRNQPDDTPRAWEKWSAEKMETPIAVSEAVNLIVR